MAGGNQNVFNLGLLRALLHILWDYWPSMCDLSLWLELAHIMAAIGSQDGSGAVS